MEQPPENPPLSPADQWALQQMREAREKKLMNRIIGLVALAALIVFGLITHWIPWPF